jgi:tetratricopeptide (TPR) repeat protein
MRIRILSVLLLTGTFFLGNAVAADDLSSLMAKGREAFGRGNYAEAEHYHRLALAAAEHSGDQAQFAETMGNLAGALLARGQYAEAKRLCLQALVILRNSPAKRHLPIVLNNLGVLSTEAGEYAKAESYLKESYEVAQEINPKDPYIVRVLNNLGVLYYQTGRIGETEKAFRKAIAVLEKESGNPAELVSLLTNLGGLYVVRRKWDDAAAMFDRALSVIQNYEGPHDPDLAGVLHNVGTMHFERGNLVDAQSAFKKAYALRLGVFGPKHRIVAFSALSLAITQAAAGHYDEAEPLFENVLQVYETTQGGHSVEAAITLEHMASLFRKTGRAEQADRMGARARSIRFELAQTVRVGQVHQ